MYCNNCGAKNPDNAKFCNNCGSRMNGGSAGQSAPSRKSGGFFKRVVVSALVFALFYAGSYALTSMMNEKKDTSEKIDIGLTPPASSGITVSREETQAPAPAASLEGYWEDVRLQDGSFNLNVSALTFNQTVYNCTGLTVNMNVQMNAGTSCKDWQLWGRSGGSFVKLAKIYLPAGDGSVSQSVTFPMPVTFDSLAVTPTIVGSYSWSMSLDITDVRTN